MESQLKRRENFIRGTKTCAKRVKEIDVNNALQCVVVLHRALDKHGFHINTPRISKTLESSNDQSACELLVIRLFINVKVVRSLFGFDW